MITEDCVWVCGTGVGRLKITDSSGVEGCGCGCGDG